MRLALEWMASGALLALGCTDGLAAPVAVTDATGAQVMLRAPAERVVSLAPHATELLYAA